MWSIFVFSCSFSFVLPPSLKKFPVLYYCRFVCFVCSCGTVVDIYISALITMFSSCLLCWVLVYWPEWIHSVIALKQRVENTRYSRCYLLPLNWIEAASDVLISNLILLYNIDMKRHIKMINKTIDWNQLLQRFDKFWLSLKEFHLQENSKYRVIQVSQQNFFSVLASF